MAKLIIGSSEDNSNIFYASKFMAPDAFTYIEIKNRKIIVVNDLEFDRAKSQSAVDEVLSYSFYEKIARKRSSKAPTLIDVIIVVLRERNIKNLVVPDDFNISYADVLRKRGFRLKVKECPFFESREIKTAHEIDCIVKSQRATEDAVGKAIDFIKNSRVKAGFLYTTAGRQITSEMMKKMVNVELLKNGYIGNHTIVSCGKQSCEPHNLGSGPLTANEPIIFDVFPRDELTGYYADMTRTVVKGKAPAIIKKMHNAVLSAQETAFNLAKNGAKGNIIHANVVKTLKNAGFKTGKKAGKIQGFFHGTGHGLGLDVHEGPRLSKVNHVLKTGNVVTVEPGLYYPGIGGLRIEDLIVITDNGCVNLTKMPKKLEI